MKRKRTRHSLSSSHQQWLSKSTRSKSVSATYFYLPHECWEFVFKFLINCDENNSCSYFKSLSVVLKQFLSITNRLRFSLNIWSSTRPFLPSLFRRFINLTSLNLRCYFGSLNKLLLQISCFPLKITSLNLSNHPTTPAYGLQVFSQNITTLTSLKCSDIESFSINHVFLIADCFPLLEELDLSNPKLIDGYGISEEGIGQVLRRCCNIRHLNIACCSRVNLCGMKFDICKLEALNLSDTIVDDKTLYVISKSCCGLLQLLLEKCYCVTSNGVKHVVENCTLLREIDLRGCYRVDKDVVTLMGFSRPSLRKITV